MNGPIAQALALVVAGNARLAGRDVTGFWPDASVFSFTKRCEFISEPLEWGYRPTETFTLPDPRAWFAWLEGRGCQGLWLDYQRRPHPDFGSDRMLVGLAGGGPRWIIGARRPEGSDLWEGHDRVEDQNDPQRKIWATRYNRFEEAWPHVPLFPTVADSAGRLKAALTAIEPLAAELDANHFGDGFRQALALLDGKATAGEGYHADIARFGDLDDEARRLLEACTAAWVFGAMGSWNDLGQEGKEPYDSLSEELFSALVDAVATIGNSTYRGPMQGS